MAHDVFVSYSQKDKATADAVVARLEQDGSRCWIAPRDILPGTSWGDAIVDAIAGSRVMVLVLSANSNRSRQVIREVERAVAGDVIILPFRIENVDPTGALAYFLGTEHWLDAITPPMERHIERLSKTVRLLITREPVPREDLDKPPAVLGGKRRSAWRSPAIAGASLLTVGLVVAFAVLGLPGRGNPPPATGSPSAAEVSTSPAASVVAVGLEEVGRYRPLDLDPGDLDPAGPIAGFAIEAEQLAYANGPDGVTLMTIENRAVPRAVATFDVEGARGVAFAGDHLVAIRGEVVAPSVSVFPIDGSGGVEVPITGAGITTLYDVAVSDGYAYLASHNFAGIVDLTVPEAASLVFSWAPPGSTGNPASVFVRDAVAYIGAGWDGLYMFDVQTPATPALLGHWVSPDWVIDIAVVDGIAYLTLGDSGVAVVDLTEPSNPRLVGSVAAPGFAGPIAVRDGQAFVGWFGESGSVGGVAVVDATRQDAPRLVGTFGAFASLTDVAVADDHLIVSDESDGLVMFRITGID